MSAYLDNLRVLPSAWQRLGFALVLVRDHGRTAPDWRALMARHELDRSTAHRWQDAYRLALGLPVGAAVPAGTARAMRVALKFGLTRPSLDALRAELDTSRSGAYRAWAAWEAVEAAA